MKPLSTTGIILRRTNFGEADRIVTLLTPDYGKLRLMAKGVRKVKSKLAGGIELFSVSQISFIKGRGDIGTLISSRLVIHYGTIVKNLERTMLAYELIKRIDKATEDEPEAAYFELLQQAFIALADVHIDLTLIEVWFSMQLLKLAGHSPNLQTDPAGNRLTVGALYNFSFDDMVFVSAPAGRFNANHIKLLRLGFGQHQPKALQQVEGIETLLPATAPLIQTMLHTHIRI